MTITRLEELRREDREQLARMTSRKNLDDLTPMLLRWLVIRMRIITIASSEPRQDMLRTIKTLDLVTSELEGLKIR